MNNDTSDLLKIIFGGIIFLFAVAFAYFAASYLNSSSAFDYWLTLAMAGMLYVIIGIGISQIFPVSFGFLFAADVLLIHTLSEKFSSIPTPAKTLLLGGVLIILYFFAWWKTENNASDNLIPSRPS